MLKRWLEDGRVCGVVGLEGHFHFNGALDSSFSHIIWWWFILVSAPTI